EGGRAGKRQRDGENRHFLHAIGPWEAPEGKITRFVGLKGPKCVAVAHESFVLIKLLLLLMRCRKGVMTLVAFLSLAAFDMSQKVFNGCAKQRRERDLGEASWG